MPGVDPWDSAERLLHGIDVGILTTEARIAFARALIHLADVDERRTHVLIALLPLVDADDAAILKAVIRRRVRVLPPPPGVLDGLRPNGGE